MAKPAKSFDKFINKPVKGAKIKEAFRQEKKAAIREKREAIEKRFEEKRQQKQAMYEARQQQGNTGNTSPAFQKKAAGKAEGPRPRSGGSTTGKKWDKPARPAENQPTDQGGRRFGKNSADRKPFKKDDRPQNNNHRREAPAPARPDGFKKDKIVIEKSPDKSASRPVARSSDKPESTDKLPARPANARPEKPLQEEKLSPATHTTPQPPVGRIAPAVKYQRKPAQPNAPAFKKGPGAKAAAGKQNPADESMPLNKFLAHAGICSRRDAAGKVRQGLAAVNGQTITEPAFKVSDTDVITFDGKKIHRSRNHVYILLNKPKDTITTSDDPQGRKTVMDIIRPATQERVYPVGRLDRNTSGVLLLTNDGDLAQQLSHPSFEVRKIYEVKLDKALTQGDFNKILDGITLEDGEIHADTLAYSDTKDRSVIGIEIHSGRNRIVRRMFEHLGYDVRGLDRVMYANLTKKNVERGHWRLLNEKEVRLLKYFNKSKKKEAHSNDEFGDE